MTNLYRISNSSKCAFNFFRLSSSLKKCRILSRSFSLSNVEYNHKCIYSVHKCKPNPYAAGCLKKIYSTFNNDEIFSTEWEIDELEANNSSFVNIDRKYLYPNTTDELLLEIINCNSIQDIFDILNNKFDSLNHKHVCQMILGLCCIQKNYCEEYIEHLEKNDIDISPNEMLSNFISQVTSQKEFNVLKKFIHEHCNKLSVKELTFCMYYFRKIQLANNDELKIKLMSLVEDKIANFKHEWTLTELVIYTHSVKTNESLRFVYNVRPTIPLILDFFDKCKSEDDFKNITICMQNTHSLITMPTLNAHKKKCIEFINSGTITCNHVDTILRIISFYNLLHWSHYNTNDISYLCKLLQQSIKTMNANDVIFLHRIYQIHYSPASIIRDIGKRVAVLLEEMKHDDRIKAYLKLPDLLYCQVSTTSLSNKNNLEDITKDLLKEKFSSIFPSLYSTLRYLKTSNEKLCNIFWKYILNISLKSPDKENDMLRLCYKYMHFNNNLGGTYRNSDFEENLLIELFAMKDASYSISPWKFSRISAFIFSYGLHKMDTKTLNDLIDKLCEFLPQLKPQDIILLSKGIQIYLIYRNTKFSLKYYEHPISRFTSILDNHCRNMLFSENISLYTLNMIFRANINMRTFSYKSDYLDRILLLYENHDSNLTPRLIRDACYNQYVAGVYSPNFTDRVVDYVTCMEHDFSAEILNKVLMLCYICGHTIKNDLFLKQAAEIVERNFEAIPALSLLDSCLSLCYYQNLPESIIKNIFSLEFMERIDKEIAYCYSKKVYPVRLRKRLMLLNRTVCLDFPQYQVPWFHKKYIEENIASASSQNTNFFFNDVLATLLSIGGKEETINYPSYSPYGYKIDFLLNLDKNGNFLSKNYINDSSIAQKIAVILLYKSCFVKMGKKIKLFNETETIMTQNILKGSTIMRKRHVELLGYKVIEIPYMLWNSMHMTEPQAKYNFLTSKIWPEREVLCNS